MGTARAATPNAGKRRCIPLLESWLPSRAAVQQQSLPTRPEAAAILRRGVPNGSAPALLLPPKQTRYTRRVQREIPYDCEHGCRQLWPVAPDSDSSPAAARRQDVPVGFPGFRQAGADQQPASNAGREERAAVGAAPNWKPADDLSDHRLRWQRHKHVPGPSQQLPPVPAAAAAGAWDMLKGDVIKYGFIGAARFWCRLKVQEVLACSI